MDNSQIKTLIELTAIKAAKAVIKEAKEEWQKDISLHSAQCAANKYKGVKTLVTATVGGVIVAVVNWLFRK